MKNKYLVPCLFSLSTIAMSIGFLAFQNRTKILPIDAATKTYTLTMTISEKYSGSKTIKTTNKNDFKYSYNADYDALWNNTSIKSITSVTVTFSKNSRAAIYFGNSVKPDQNNYSRCDNCTSGQKVTTSGYHYFRVVTNDLMMDIDISKVVITYSC